MFGATSGRTAWQAGPPALLAWSPLASGWLTGKYRRGEPPAPGTRVVENADEGMRIWNQRGGSEQTWQVLDAVRKVAGGRRVSLAQFTDNLAAADLQFSTGEMQLLDEASEPPAPDYPYGQPGQSQRSRRIR